MGVLFWASHRALFCFKLCTISDTDVLVPEGCPWREMSVSLGDSCQDFSGAP